MSLHQITAEELARLYKEKKISSKEILDPLFARIEAFDPKVGSFLSLSKEKAYKKGEALDKRRDNGEKLGALAGVPFAIKDNLHVQGEISTAGSKILKNYVAPFSATACRKLDEADGIYIGKTNCDEFAMGSSTENSGFQPTRNPWDLKAVPGGSSGGSAAAVAAGFVPLSLGSDTGGSIRQPASFCGILGLKPTYGRISRFGLIAYGSSLDVVGPMARSVGDLQIAMEVMSGQCPHDSTSLPNKESFLQKALPLQGVRIGVPWAFLKDLSAESKSLFEATIQNLTAQGAKIVEVNLDLLRYSLPVYYILATAEASTNLARYDGIRYGYRSPQAKNLNEIYTLSREEGFGNEVKRRILLGTFVLSSGYQEAYYLKGQQVRTLIIEMYKKAFEACDFIATPTTPFSAFPLGEKQDPVQMYLEDIYTIGVNLAGVPGISLPTSKTSSGKPMGLQLIAPFGEDCRLLQFCKGMEEAKLISVEEPQGMSHGI